MTKKLNLSKKLRRRNLVTLAALIGFMLLFYGITVARLSGH